MCSSYPNLPTIDQADLGVLLSVYGLQATGAIRAKFTWDAENRLVDWEPLLFVSGAKKVEFKYDYLGRRIEKKVHEWTLSDPNDPNTGSWQTHETRRFVWNTAASPGTPGDAGGWLLLLELTDSGGAGFQPARKLTWGRDLSGQRSACGTGFQPVPVGCLDGAGGIGGLLAIQDANGTPASDTDDLRYVYSYDANGKVGQLVDLAHDPNDPAGAIKAHYEYDAHGKVLVPSGSYAGANPFRFSTTPWDDETGLGYWGHRYYDPRLGRWISRDPIADAGGHNYYSYVLNSTARFIDSLGLKCTPPNGCTGVPDEPFGFRFTPCCDAHDECYCTCGTTKSGCDDAFLDCLERVCQKEANHYLLCLWVAGWYHYGVKALGSQAWCDAQASEGCPPSPECIPVPPYDPPPGCRDNPKRPMW